MGTEIKAKPKLDVIKEDEIHHLLEAGEVGAILELIVTDKDGNITEKRVMKSRSFVRQFMELLWAQAYQISENTPYNITDTGAGAGTVRTISEGTLTFAANANAADITFGPVVGTDNTPATINDHRLGVIILHDAAPPTANRLQYGLVAFGAPASDATTSQFTITRNFANASGGAITVQEIGLYVKGLDPNTTYYFMTIRDVVAIAIPNGQTLTVNYRLQAQI